MNEYNDEGFGEMMFDDVHLIFYQNVANRKSYTTKSNKKVK